MAEQGPKIKATNEVSKNSKVANPITGIPDGYNAHYGVPVVHHRTIGRLRLTRQNFAENRVRMPGNKHFCFLSRLTTSDTLVVTFHGANMASKNQPYPRYERARTFMKTDASFACIADSTIQDTDLLLAWYLGDQKHDPMSFIDVAVSRAMKKIGASRVIFVGGSGGGYAAMRAALRTPNGHAFLESPRLFLDTAAERSMRLYLKQFWRGKTVPELQKLDPERFDAYRSQIAQAPAGKIYYLQGLYDPTFLWNEYRLAKELVGLDSPLGTSPTGSVRFELFESETQKHGPPPFEIFKDHWRQANEFFGTAVRF
ncbi:alpha/beta hydrolase family protein [Corynebacterium casei]|uniref:alpha/beta hydrolase family protein n=1 Tax=Corynebacterium casei TaxID=160386 RepID=UPI003FD2B8BB